MVDGRRQSYGVRELGGHLGVSAATARYPLHEAASDVLDELTARSGGSSFTASRGE